MRKIIFRGKSTSASNAGEWVYGNFVKSEFEDTDDFEYEILNQDHFGGCCPVDPKTVGEYLGFTDRNKKMIFEGDVLYDSESGSYYRVLHGGGVSGFCFLPGLTGGHTSNLKYSQVSNMIVVGNIHDSLDMLGKAL